MHAAEIGMYNQTRGCHVLLLLPRLDVAEPCKASVFGQRYDSLGLHHLLGQILVCTFGNTRTSYFSSLGNGVEYGVNIFQFAVPFIYLVLFNLYDSTFSVCWMTLAASSWLTPSRMTMKIVSSPAIDPKIWGMSLESMFHAMALA